MSQTRNFRSSIFHLLACMVILLGGCAKFAPRESLAQGYPLEPAAWNPQTVEQVISLLANEKHVDSFCALRGDKTILCWGDYTTPTNLHSARKSVISSLYGIAVAKGKIRLNDTLADLGIDEPNAPLSAKEKSATVRDLLMARSGVYIPSGGETETSKRERPRRGEYSPGEHFYYNNWDFNALGTIFEQRTGLTIGQAFQDWIAKPIGMEDFSPAHVIWSHNAKTTRYPTYYIYMSARDLARFGSLFLHDGQWRKVQVIPASWVRESTTLYSEVPEPDGRYFGYGYLWWVFKGREGAFCAAGWGGQLLVVDKLTGLVLVQRTNTGTSPVSSLWFRLFGKSGDRMTIFTIYSLLAKDIPGARELIRP